MSEINNSEEPDGAQKLRSDLDAVMERVQLCREIMLESPGIQYDDTLAGVIGFLEACRDRMAQLIEAGTQGELTEELFAQCLTVNDAVCRTLEAEKTGTKLPVDGSSNKAEKTEKSLLDLGDEDDQNDSDLPVRKAATSSNPTSVTKEKSFTKPKPQEDSLLAPYVPPPAPAVPVPPVAAVATADDDPFAGFDTKPIDDLPAPPSSSTSQTASASVPATTTAPVDVNDLDALMASTSVSPPAPPASASSDAKADAAAEFDAFLDSLNEPTKPASTSAST
mmetsp:Transcript_53743/g.106014  ORF Transcript_53743/g.106014 Transcript_53743/m.106014 type:complete len:279 (+) Transcript_53743:103-939(+)